MERQTNKSLKKLKVCKSNLRSVLTLKFSRSRVAAASFLLLLMFAVSSAAQVRVAPKPPVPPKTPPARIWKTTKQIPNDEIPAEKSIATDAKVNVSLCVSEGSVKINGWERSEIRAFVRGGSSVGFKVLQKKNQSPVWVMIQGFDAQKNQAADADECLSGDEIEIDVPRGATVNLKAHESKITVESINKAKIENDSGDISFNGIAQGIDAKTYEGDVTVEKSAGAMTLLSTTGNIVAFETAPSDIGDVFKAKTSSGAITLQNIGHAQVEAGSNSGAIRFVGAFAGGGQYNLGTTNGTILLSIPQESSFKLNASYGGAFQTEIPLKDTIKTGGGQVQKLTATLGAGDTNLNLVTLSGAIRIRKK